MADLDPGWAMRALTGRTTTPQAVIRCARKGCGATTRRDVRLGDSLPAPADAGWYEVAMPAPSRTVLFCCSQRCATFVATGADALVRAGLEAFSDQPVLPS